MFFFVVVVFIFFFFLPVMDVRLVVNQREGKKENIAIMLTKASFLKLEA